MGKPQTDTILLMSFMNTGCYTMQPFSMSLPNKDFTMFISPGSTLMARILLVIHTGSS